MFKHSFETTSGIAIFPQSLPGKLLVAKAENALLPVAGKKNILVLLDKTPLTKDIPPFNHPYFMENTEGKTTVINLAPYRGVVQRNESGEVILPTMGAAGILARRTLLEEIWSNGDVSSFFFNIDVPLTVFSLWLGGLLKSRLTLNDETAMKAEALTAYYYLCLHLKEEDFDEKKLEIVAIKVNRILRIPIQTLKDWFSPVGYLANLDAYCDALRKFGGSMSFKNLDKRAVWNLTSTSWFGSTDTKELIAAALEYPPAFNAIVYSGIGEKFYRKAFLSHLIERTGKRLDTRSFISGIDGTIRSLAEHS